MATIKKPIIITKPASLTATTITTSTAKKPLKPDILQKTPMAAPKSTSLASKTPLKPVVSKMASTKVAPVTVNKSASSLKPTPVKSIVTSPPKPVPAKATIKSAVADSTTSVKESAPLPVRKLSMTTGVTKVTKAVTKPITSSLTSGTKVAVVKAKTTLTNKLPAKPVAEKLPAKPKAVSSTSAKTSLPLTKPVTSTLTKRPLAPKTTDVQKKTVVSKPTVAKSVSKTPTPVVKPPSIRTPIAGKKVIKKCTEVQICDADSTSVNVNDQLELGLEYGTVVPGETSIEFNEIQAYKVAEQMMEALGTAVVTNEPVQQDSVLKDSVVIDMSALEMASLAVPIDEELTEMSVGANVLEQTTDCVPAKQEDNEFPEVTDEKASIPDLISFAEATQEEELAKGEPIAEYTSAEIVETAIKDAVNDTLAEPDHDQNEDNESSVENQVSESDEFPSDEAAAGSSDESEPMLELPSDEQITEHCAKDETQQVENCSEFAGESKMTNGQGDFIGDNEIEDENVRDYESCSIGAELDQKTETEEQGEVIDETPSTADMENTSRNDEDGASPAGESQPEQSEEISEAVVDPAVSIEIQEDHFCVDSDPASVDANSECNRDDFVVIDMGEKNDDQDLEQVPLIIDDSSDIEKSADLVKQPAVECASDFEAIKDETPVDLKIEKDTNTCQVSDSNHQSTIINEEIATEGTETTEATDDAGDAEGTESSENVEAVAAEENPAEQKVTVEPLLGVMTDEVQQELDAGMEQNLTADEEGYMKVQRKRNKRTNKRNRKSLKAFQKQNTDPEPVAEVTESQDDMQVFQKRRNSRRARNSPKRQNRRYSEPYSNFHCYSTPVWKSYYVEH